MSLAWDRYDDDSGVGLGDAAPVGLRARVWAALGDGLAEQRDRIFLWCPVFFGAGIGVYLSVENEPQRWVLILNATLALCAAWAAFVPVLRGPAFLIIWMCAGFGGAALRSAWVSAPVLMGQYSGPVEGTITLVDRASNGRMRLTLGDLRMHMPRGEGTPRLVRVSLARVPDHFLPTPGQRIAVSARLNAPAAPTEPGGYDFRRLAWFRGLGGTGYATGPPVRLPSEAGGITSRIDRLRMSISRGLQQRLGPRDGGFAAAILTGDRSALDGQVVEQLRKSNLAHLMAISGLHMGLMSGLAFALARLLLALMPALALRTDTKVAAAIFASLVTFAYLLISGNGVPAQRAFVMVLVVMGAVVLGRRAITLRSLAVAAVIVLALRPESLAEPGFQMSFAATTALVAAFGALSGPAGGGGSHAAVRWVLFLGLSSLVAGMATAPFAAAHFNRVPSYGLAANMLAVPVMGFVVMPAALAAAVSWLVGAETAALSLMALGIEWILQVAKMISDWPGAVHWIKSPPAGTIPLLSAGGLILTLWKGWERVAGLVLVMIAGAWWASGPRPLILVADQGKQIGIMLGDGTRALRPARGGRFITSSWLENDGRGQERAAARHLWPDRFPVVLSAGWRLSDIKDGLIVLDAPDPDRGSLILDPRTMGPGEVAAVWPDGSLTTTEPKVRVGRPWAPATDQQ